jgi:hypothetical protein
LCVGCAPCSGTLGALSCLARVPSASPRYGGSAELWYWMASPCHPANGRTVEAGACLAPVHVNVAARRTERRVGVSSVRALVCLRVTIPFVWLDSACGGPCSGSCTAGRFPVSPGWKDTRAGAGGACPETRTNREWTTGGADVIATLRRGGVALLIPVLTCGNALHTNIHAATNAPAVVVRPAIANRAVRAATSTTNQANGPIACGRRQAAGTPGNMN